jgi:hypothetical protein
MSAGRAGRGENADEPEVRVHVDGIAGIDAAGGVERLSQLDVQVARDLGACHRLIGRTGSRVRTFREHPPLSAVFRLEREMPARKILELGEEPLVDGVDAVPGVRVSRNEGDAAFHHVVGEHLLVVGPLDFPRHLFEVIERIERDLQRRPLRSEDRVDSEALLREVPVGLLAERRHRDEQRHAERDADDRQRCGEPVLPQAFQNETREPHDAPPTPDGVEAAPARA